MQLAPPNIVKSSIVGLPLEFPWKGQGLHYGPSQGTKLHDALSNLTTCAQAGVATLFEECLLWRLQSGVRFDVLLHHVHATLAWAIDWRYRDDSTLTLSVDTPANQAIYDGVWMLQLITQDRLWKRPEFRFDKTAALISVTKQTLPPTQAKSYLSWVQSVIQTAQTWGACPEGQWPRRKEFESETAYHEAVAPFFGKALPREALDPDSGYKPEQREELLNRFLAGLDWNANPFLRSPEKMKELDFEGTPYKL
jgi:hypothetical protein